MKKALKILAWILLGILALVLVLVLAIPLWLGPTVASVANKIAPEYTGTSFKLEKVGINPYSGKYRLGPLVLGNPEGYPVPVAFAVSNILVDVEMSSLFTDTIHIREITIENPYASYVSANGTNNFEWIAAHAQEKIGPKEEEEEEEEEGPKKKVIIDVLTISGTHVKYSVMPEMPIPTITIKDIGKEKGGASWEEAGKAIMENIMKAGSSLGEGITSALGGATELISGATTNALEGASKALDGATGLISGATTNVLGGAKKALGNIGGLLGGSEDGKAEKPAADKPAGDKPAGSGVIDAGKAVGNGALDAGKAVGNGALDAGKSVGKGAIDAGKALGEGAKETGKAIGDGLKKLNPFGK